MCHIFAGQSPDRYASETRSVRLAGHGTSIRLEKAYWEILEEVSSAQDLTLAKFLTLLHDEILEMNGEVQNFTSLLRCACLTYMEEINNDQARLEALRAEAHEAQKLAVNA